MAQGLPPYQNVPLYQYYTTPTTASTAVQPIKWTRSFYKPSPTSNAAPAGTTRVNWRQSIDAQYVANTKPSGTSYTLPGTTTALSSAATGLAAEYAPGKGKELQPIPQATLSADPALKQNFGY